MWLRAELIPFPRRAHHSHLRGRACELLCHCLLCSILEGSCRWGSASGLTSRSTPTDFRGLISVVLGTARGGGAGTLWSWPESALLGRWLLGHNLGFGLFVSSSLGALCIRGCRDFPSDSVSWERMLRIFLLRITALSFLSAFSCSYRLLASRNFQGRRKCRCQTHKCCTAPRATDQAFPIILLFLSMPVTALLWACWLTAHQGCSQWRDASPSDKSSQTLQWIFFGPPPKTGLGSLFNMNLGLFPKPKTSNFNPSPWQLLPHMGLWWGRWMVVGMLVRGSRANLSIT